MAVTRNKRERRWSLPTRGAWIETLCSPGLPCRDPRRSPHGERGLKQAAVVGADWGLRRSPYGERGLKQGRGVVVATRAPVAPHTGSVD